MRISETIIDLYMYSRHHKVVMPNAINQVPKSRSLAKCAVKSALRFYCYPTQADLICTLFFSHAYFRPPIV